MRSGALFIVVLCTACGGGGDDDGGGGEDAGGGGGTDAAAVDAGEGPDAGGGAADAVVVRVYVEEAAVEGATVVLHGAGGAVEAEATTDAEGEVSFEDPPAGAMVTALLEAEDTPQRSAHTVVGVEAGDVIVIGEPPAVEEDSLNVRVDYMGGFTDADLYLTDMGCDAWGQGDPDALINRSIGESCLAGDGYLDGLAQARDGTTQVAFAVARNVVPLGGTTDIEMGPWMAATTREFGFVGLPDEVNGTDIDVRAELAGTSRWPAPSVDDVFTVPVDSQVDGWHVVASAQAFDGGDARTWAWRQVLPADTASPHAIDFADLGPRFDTLAIDPSTAARPELSWTTSASTDDHGSIRLIVTWFDPEQVPDGGHRWTLLLPADTTTFTLPALPASAASYRPTATADYQYLQIFALWFARHPTYAAVRNDRPFSLALTDGLTDEARLSYFQQDLE